MSETSRPRSGGSYRTWPGDLPLSRHYAAARRATRRRPLGEPPLVVTTHAITSFAKDPPVPRESSLGRERALARRTTLRATRADQACVPSGRQRHYTNPRAPVKHLIGKFAENSEHR